MSYTVIIVENDPATQLSLANVIAACNYSPIITAEGREALKLSKAENPAMMLLALMLPDMDGFDVARQLRKESTIPLVVVSARTAEVDRICAFELGADDYITKPFSLEEMLARVRAVLRRTDPARAVGQTFRFADLDIDIQALHVTRDGQTIQISAREAGIIQHFAANPGRVISREELYRQVWKETLTDLGTRTVDMHIAKLRARIEVDSNDPRIIQTVRGAGYRYVP